MLKDDFLGSDKVSTGVEGSIGTAGVTVKLQGQSTSPALYFPLASSALADFADPLGHGDDGQDRRITQRFRDERRVSNVEVFRKPVVMKRFGLAAGERQHPARMPGIERP